MNLEGFEESFEKLFDVVLKEDWKEIYNTVTAERLVSGRNTVMLHEELAKEQGLLHVWDVDPDGDYLVTMQSDRNLTPYYVYPEMVEKVKETVK